MLCQLYFCWKTFLQQILNKNKLVQILKLYQLYSRWKTIPLRYNGQFVLKKKKLGRGSKLQQHNSPHEFIVQMCFNENKGDRASTCEHNCTLLYINTVQWNLVRILKLCRVYSCWKALHDKFLSRDNLLNILRPHQLYSCWKTFIQWIHQGNYLLAILRLCQFFFPPNKLYKEFHKGDVCRLYPCWKIFVKFIHNRNNLVAILRLCQIFSPLSKL